MSEEWISVAMIAVPILFVLCMIGVRALVDWEWGRGKRLTWRELWNLLVTGRLEGRVKK